MNLTTTLRLTQEDYALQAVYRVALQNFNGARTMEKREQARQRMRACAELLMERFDVATEGHYIDELVFKKVEALVREREQPDVPPGAVQ